MPIDATCPTCGRELYLKDELAGRQIRCPQCQGVLTVPAPEYSAPWAQPIEPPPPEVEGLSATPQPGPVADPYSERLDEPGPTPEPQPEEPRPRPRVPEREGGPVNAGLGGGILMIVLAAIIFGGGLALDVRIIRLPIILVIAGVAAIFRGLAGKRED
jgi:predicted lipid-binding transport protein (Tim44 family)